MNKVAKVVFNKMAEENTVFQYGSEFNAASEKAQSAYDKLAVKLNDSDRTLLAELDGCYGDRQHIILEESFMKGFRAAVELGNE